MGDLNNRIENHYFREELYEDIVHRLQEQDRPLTNITRSDIAGVDEFHVRGGAVSQELARSVHLAGAKVLDIGCGLGGPSRMLADEYNCRVTGIDLSEEYVRTARKLSALVNLADKTQFVHGNATELPFDTSSFDVVWTQHVQMNIPNKEKFYSEIVRVLKTDGLFLYYEILKKGDGEVTYPMPWAGTADLSFLFKPEKMDSILRELGLTKVQSTNQTPAGIDFFEAFLARIHEAGPPKVGLNILMGETTQVKLTNLLNHLKNGELALESGVYRR